MSVCLITGGARAGKSRYAHTRAAAAGETVTYVATARRNDEEMRRRIERHQRARPASWQTIEAPTNAGAAIRAARTDVVVLDCLTVLAGNALSGATDDEETALGAIDAETDGILNAIRERTGLLIVVSNEVGLGIHPPSAVGRWYRDGLGLANQRLADIADEVVLMLAGQPVPIKRAGRTVNG